MKKFVKGDNLIPKDIRRILLIQLGDIGDVVLSFPAIRTLRENLPQAEVIVAVREKAAELIEDCPWTSDVISINTSKRRWYQELIYQKDFLLRLWNFNFDLAFDLRTGTRGAILALLSGARQRIGFYASDGKLWRNRVFTHLAHLEGKPGQHLAEYYRNLLIAYDLKTENIWPEIIIPEEKLQKADQLFKTENILPDLPAVAIQPFSLWPYKEWGVEKYIDLIHRISAEYELSIIVTGSTDEREKANKLMNKCGRHVYSFAGKTTIGMFAAVLKLSQLFIGGDSAGIHVASAVGTPTVGIFGPMSVDAWAPRGPQHQVVYKNMACVPCHQKGCQGGGFSRCLEELTVDEVLLVVKSQIDKIYK